MFEGFDFKRFKLDDAVIHCGIGGQGPALVLLHGYPQTHVAWHKIAEPLSERFTVIVPDLRGYGASRGPNPDDQHVHYSKRAMAWDIVQLIERLGYPTIQLAGHDRGARVGYRLCLDHPERVSRFAALDIVPTGDTWREMDADKALAAYHWQFLAVPAPLPETLIAANPSLFIKHLLKRWAGDYAKLSPQAIGAYVKQFENVEVRSATCADYRAGASVDRALDEADMRAGRKLNCPVLFMWGRDYLTDKASSPLSIWQRWADDVQEVVLDCGHFLAEEKPDETTRALIKFFE